MMQGRIGQITRKGCTSVLRLSPARQAKWSSSAYLSAALLRRNLPHDGDKMACPFSLFGRFGSAEAQVINAASCSQSDVQTAFNSVSASTTTVNIPACSGGVGWSNQVSLTVPSGSTTLSILGAGSLSSQGGGDATVIIDNYASSNALLIINTAGQSSFLRLAGITFQGGSGAAKWNGIVNLQGLSQNVRVDHSHFNTMTYSPAVASSSLQFNGCLYGVTDHSIFDNPAGSVNNSFRAYNAGSCNNDTLGLGDQSWAAPTGLGSANSSLLRTTRLTMAPEMTALKAADMFGATTP